MNEHFWAGPKQGKPFGISIRNRIKVQFIRDEAGVLSTSLLKTMGMELTGKRVKE